MRGNKSFIKGVMIAIIMAVTITSTQLISKADELQNSTTQEGQILNDQTTSAVTEGSQTAGEQTTETTESESTTENDKVIEELFETLLGGASGNTNGSITNTFITKQNNEPTK